MIVNNFKQIADMLTFESEDDFYHLQILVRKKDLPEYAKGKNNNARCIQTYYIKTKEYLLEKEKEIIGLCHMFTARAYINLNQKSFKKASLQLLKELSDRIIYEQYAHVYGAYQSVVGESLVNVGEKRWIIDIDSKDLNLILDTEIEIEKCQSSQMKIDEIRYNNIIARIPTVNGWHIITHPFNLKQIEPFQCMHSFDVQKNNPTLLYFNKID